jgi:serine/threonine-protein kinase
MLCVVMSLEAQLPPQIAGRYRPLRILGRGGMGVVYEVEHLHTGQRLALKVLHAQLGASPEAIERFKREARTSARIQSDHVVRVTDADSAPELGGAPFLVMELLDGQDLEHATRSKPSAPAEVVEWMRQIGRALTKAHELGVVHRDLKPENLFLAHRDDGTPCVKILDFGIAKLTDDAVLATQSGQILGTPLFMAPEQAGTSTPITPRTDLFALGLIAFRLLVGRDYWREGNMVSLLAQITIVSMEPASARGSTHGPLFDAWFARACAREVQERFASVNEQNEALAKAFGLPASTHPTPSGDALAQAALEVAKTQNEVAPSSVEIAATQPAEGRSTLQASASAISSAQPARTPRRFGAASAVAVVVLVGAVVAFAARGTITSSPRDAPADPAASPPVSVVPPPAQAIADAAPSASALASSAPVAAPSGSAPAAAASLSARSPTVAAPSSRSVATKPPLVPPSASPKSTRDPLVDQL